MGGVPGERTHNGAMGPGPHGETMGILPLAALCVRPKRLVVTREFNPVWQLAWLLCRGHFPSGELPITLAGLDTLPGEPGIAGPDRPRSLSLPGSWMPCTPRVPTSALPARGGVCPNMVVMFEGYDHLDRAGERMSIQPEEAQDQKL